MGADDGWKMTDVVRGRCVQRAYLTVAFAEDDDARDLDPAEVTRLVGLSPTRQHRTGDRYGTHGHLHRRGGWYVDVPERDEYDTEIVLVELLDIIEPNADGLARARQVLGLQAGINVVIKMIPVQGPDGEDLRTTPALSLAAATVRRLADLDLWLDCDQYVY
ncbi:DUF4279 domain-containing protein [Dactylosporangium sp. NPDC049140]|uniref:DUF4279 domain-containing protein n=1 Tax=Dactylosporangium sp. NPDC049140 TaxID=3155647 RepID=UPI0033ED9035